MRCFVSLCLLLMLSVAGCGDDDGPGPGTDAGSGDAATDGGDAMPIRAECENLNPHHCMLPWPSNRFLVDDPSTPTGRRIEVTSEAVPVNQLDEPAERLDAWNRYDGFSPMTSIITLFPGPLAPSTLPAETRIADSLLPGSPTVLLDAESGERVAHFSEIDMWDTNLDPTRRSFYIRPATRLQENRRYIVAIRDLSYEDGSAVPPSDYFRALRDDEPSEIAELEARRADFEDVFTQLETAGVARDGLIEAFDFWTASGETAWGELVAMRDDAYMRVGDRGIGCTVESVEDDVNAEIWRRIRGTFTVPLYMETEFEGSGTNRNAAGDFEFNGMVEAPFEVDISVTLRDRVLAGGTPGRLVMYGHGLLGSERQVGSSGTRVALARMEAVGVGTKYWGMGEEDETWFVNNVVTNFGNFSIMAERIQQGTINSLVLARSFKGVCSELAELQIDVGGTPTPLYATDEMFYYGISQGGIFGGTVAGLTTDITQFALQVGAISYPIMINRSYDFNVFEEIYRLWYPSKVDRDWLIVASASAWDLTDPATYAPHLISDPLPGTTPKRIYYHVSEWDAQVANTASDIAARTMGLRYMRSSVYEPWNVEATDGPEDSAYVIYSLDTVTPTPRGAVSPLEDNDAHNDLRFLDPFLMQLDTFLQPDGQVVDFCPMGSCALTNTRM